LYGKSIRPNSSKSPAKSAKSPCISGRISSAGRIPSDLMDPAELDRLLTRLTPAELRERIAELDRQRNALAVLLRAVSARQLGRAPGPAKPKEVPNVT
jgi:hypothetical protein